MCSFSVYSEIILNALIYRIQVVVETLNKVTFQCIQFTIELPAMVSGNDVISFLDTEIIVKPCGKVLVAVHRKTTHTDKYLSFDSHNPKQHKAAVVKTLFNQADKIPNTIHGKKAEKQNVQKALNVNAWLHISFHKQYRK